MRTWIEIFLLIKSATGRKITYFDINIAIVVENTYIYAGQAKPEWLSVITGLNQEMPMPEAFGLFIATWQARIGERIGQLRDRLLLWYLEG